MVGVHDGDRYRWYKKVEDFLENELTSKNRGKWFYAHAGGLFDITFILDIIYKKGGYQVKCNFSGSSAVMVHVTRGKNSWHFIDSFWLFRSPLAEIGEWVGISKGLQNLGKEQKEIWYATCTLTELAEYNEADCLILWKAIDEFQDIIHQMGGELRGTIAATAMALFRRKYLNRTIHTSAYVNSRARLSYFASRVEVYRKTEESIEKKINYYDINSSFPFAMTHDCPGEVKRIGKSLTVNTNLYMAKVDVYVPDVVLPPVPHRIKERVFFPTGKWSGWLTGIDIELLEREGGKILRCYEMIEFEPFNDLAGYIHSIYDYRKKAKTPLEKQAGKYLMNCLYGKFAESEQKESIITNPQSVSEGMMMLFPGVFTVNETKAVSHVHVPIAAHVTSFARRTIFNFLNLCSEFYYSDTDGFATPDEFPTSNELGDLKLEKMFNKGVFARPKLYALEGDDIELYKAKGFSQVTRETFYQLTEGKEVSQIRMLRIRELYKKGITEPTERRIMKRLREDYIPKRFFYPDGYSRPWHIDELLGG